MIPTDSTEDLSDTVRLQFVRGVAVLLIDNPPVNGLGNTVRAGLYRGLEYAIADPRVLAVVITGAGRMFCGGADIRQFNTPAVTEPPLSRDLQALIHQTGKPVVAAIHGAALGGGLELAMACHFRVASPQAQLGLPEVQLGLIPGGGGTQRLPRIIGVRAALDLIVHGRSLSAAQAQASGLLDAVFDDDLLQAAVGFAVERAASGTPL